MRFTTVLPLCALLLLFVLISIHAESKALNNKIFTLNSLNHHDDENDQQRMNIVFLTYDLDQGNNNSIIIMDSASGKVTQKRNWSVFNYAASALNTKERLYILCDGYTFQLIDADSFLPKLTFSIQYNPTSIAYDNNLNRMFAIVQTVDNMVGEFNMKTGEFQMITKFDDSFGVILGATTYDETNHRIYAVVSAENNKYKLLEINVLTKASRVMDLPDVIDQLVYDPIQDRVLGVDNSTLFEVNLKTEKVRALVPLQPGIEELYSSAIDTVNNMYYVAMWNANVEKSYYVGVDLKTNKQVIALPIDFQMFLAQILQAPQ